MTIRVVDCTDSSFALDVTQDLVTKQVTKVARSEGDVEVATFASFEAAYAERDRLADRSPSRRFGVRVGAK